MRMLLHWNFVPLLALLPYALVQGAEILPDPTTSSVTSSSSSSVPVSGSVSATQSAVINATSIAPITTVINGSTTVITQSMATAVPVNSTSTSSLPKSTAQVPEVNGGSGSETTAAVPFPGQSSSGQITGPDDNYISWAEKGRQVGVASLVGGIVMLAGWTIL